MKIRELKEKDAPFMLEWMHDLSVVEPLGRDFMHMKLEACLNFISSHDAGNIHLAIADENDEYMGTVSLKNIDKEEGFAEFAITIRKCAMGKGYSSYGMNKIIWYGLEELGLKSIYWCVRKTNQRAIRFYDKNHYHRIVDRDVPSAIISLYDKDSLNELLWYQANNREL